MADADPLAIATGPVAAGRLAGRVALVTGAAGNLGGVIVRRLLAEGATVIMTGRTEARLQAARAAVLAETGVDEARLPGVILDGAVPDSVRSGIAQALALADRIDVLVNNGGSAGPKTLIDQVPLTREELAVLNAAGSADTETVGEAMRNLLGVTWNLVRATAPALAEGASVINVSTVFSRTAYYGRAPYVVPKAALNALSRALARELGARGIRVNTIFPGPIASERIRSVFAAMDRLRGEPAGSTAQRFFDMMTLERSVGGEARAKTFPTPSDIAATVAFLASGDSAAFNGHDFDVTHGMQVASQSRATFLARPTMRAIDGTGLGVLVAGGEAWEDALELARVQLGCGAAVMVGLSRDADVALAQARARAEGLGGRLRIVRFHRGDPAGMEAALAAFDAAGHPPLSGALVLPARAPGRWSGPLAEASDAAVEDFIDSELTGLLALARSLSRHWAGQAATDREPRALFLTGPSDGAGDAWGDMAREAAEELIRVWRDETAVETREGRRQRPVWANQIVRFTNTEAENLPFAAGHAARILLRDTRMPDISLALPPSIAEATGARKALVGAAENLAGLHLGKVALITGGSAGIGGQVARLLALAGARVMMVARRASELEAARERIIAELEEVGISGVDRRVLTMADVDVSDFASLERAFDATLAAFGRIDYLINNAGVAGAEEMAVDMDPEAWRRTLRANLVSNYLLAARAVPVMRAQGSGYILNVSSYFGGEKFLAVAYPNRSDYAVSKAGQRAMVETMARFLGPEIQFNAIAPGPVEGERLAGKDGRPGLFERRARLILANKRLNAVHGAVIQALRRGVRVEAVLARLARNDTASLSHDTDTPRELRDVALAWAREGDGLCSWDRFLLTRSLAARLVGRLRQGGWFLDSPEWGARDPAGDDGWLLRTPPDETATPFLPAGRLASEAAKIRNGVVSQIHLGGMPSEAEVAQATVFFLADRAVSGETFMPSGGLSVERSNTERELFGSPKAERVEAMRGRTVWMLAGAHLADYVVEAARQLVEVAHVARVVMIAPDEAAASALAAPLEGVAGIEAMVAGQDVEDAMDEALRRWGRPTAVVSCPLAPLPDQLFDAEAPLSADAFEACIETNLTQHFRVTRKAALYDDCQLILVTPDVPMGGSAQAFALANFFKTTLHAFTATAAVESERLVHDAPVNQINLTRRVRSEEPRNLEEHLEETRRFARAVLLLGAPLPDAEDSRYRSRIYRGLSMTV